MTDNKNLISSPPCRRFFDLLEPARLLRWKAVVPILIGLFVILSFGADLIWPTRKSYFATYNETFKNFTVLHPVPTRSFLAPGGAGLENHSPLYMVLLRVIYLAVPHRLAAMRVLSVLCALGVLLLLFRMISRLFSIPLAAVFLFLLVTSPIYVESMRAFGYQSLSHLLVILVVYLTVRSGKSILASVAAALCGVLTLSLYVVARPVVVFPVLFFALDLKRFWKKLLVYLAVFTVLATAAGLASRRPLLYPWRHLISPEEQAGLWPVVEGRVIWGDLRDYLGRNLGLAAGYLLNLGRRPFADREDSSRLFNLAYTPFFLLGLVEIWRRKREGAKTVLLTLFLFFILPMASVEIQPRRMLMGIYPVYLLIVLGMSLFYRLILRHNRLSGVLSVVAFLVVGGWDVNEFLFQVSRPRLSYNRSELRAMAWFVESVWKEVPHIRYFKDIDELIMGNPYFVPQPEKDFQVANIFAEEWADLRRTLTVLAARAGEDLIYLYTESPMRVGDSLAWADEKLAELIHRQAVPGVRNLSYLRASLSRIAPNLIFKADETLKIRIEGELGSITGDQKEFQWRDSSSYGDLLDGDTATFVNISPPGPLAPIAIEFDFGERINPAVRGVSFLVPRQKEEHFFRQAGFFGSSDGKEWENLNSFVVPRRPQGGEWLIFDFDNHLPRRFYRLAIHPENWAGENGPIALAGIWMFDAVDRKIKIEDIYSNGPILFRR